MENRFISLAQTHDSDVNKCISLFEREATILASYLRDIPMRLLANYRRDNHNNKLRELEVDISLHIVSGLRHLISYINSQCVSEILPNVARYTCVFFF